MCARLLRTGKECRNQVDLGHPSPSFTVSKSHYCCRIFQSKFIKERLIYIKNKYREAYKYENNLIQSYLLKEVIQPFKFRVNIHNFDIFFSEFLCINLIILLMCEKTGKPLYLCVICFRSHFWVIHCLLLVFVLCFY